MRSSATRNAILAIGLLGLVLGCESTPCPENRAVFTADAVDEGPFARAVEEMEAAILATPRWETEPVAVRKVQGHAAIALLQADRLNVVREDGSSLFCAGAIELAKIHVRRRARLAAAPESAEDVCLIADPDAEVERTLDERAYVRTQETLSLVECYLSMSHRFEWLHQVALPALRRDFERVRDTRPESRWNWSHRVVRDADFDALRERIVAALAALDAGAPGMMEPMGDDADAAVSRAGN